MEIHSHKDLKVWQASMALAAAIYGVTKKFPQDERYGLTAQLRRAAVSVPSNIAEGHARESTKEYLHHLSIAQGSLAEVETQVMLAMRLDYLHESDLDTVPTLIRNTRRMLFGLRNALRPTPTPDPRPPTPDP